MKKTRPKNIDNWLSYMHILIELKYSFAGAINAKKIGGFSDITYQMPDKRPISQKKRA